MGDLDPMIYLLGGAPRCGKSILARQLCRDTALPVVSTDLLRGVLVRIVPDLLDALTTHHFQAEADIFFPHLEQTIAVLGLQHPNALVEGVGFFPRHVHRLHETGNDVRACFLARSDATVEDIFSHPSDHTIYQGLSLAEQRSTVASIVEWSASILAEANAFGVPAVDLAHCDFDTALATARHALQV